jgi:hypothetical protein
MYMVVVVVVDIGELQTAAAQVEQVVVVRALPVLAQLSMPQLLEPTDLVVAAVVVEVTVVAPAEMELQAVLERLYCQCQPQIILEL